VPAGQDLKPDAVLMQQLLAKGDEQKEPPHAETWIYPRSRPVLASPIRGSGANSTTDCQIVRWPR
jgi:hypothetical protein